VVFNRRLSFIDEYLSRLVAVDPTAFAVLPGSPSKIKEFAIFFIVCSYLKSSQNAWVSIKENE